MVNHKRVYRLLQNDGLSLRFKKPRRIVSVANRERQPAASAMMLVEVSDERGSVASGGQFR
jgi:hypothetical protein